MQVINFFVQLTFEHLRTRYLDRTMKCTEVIFHALQQNLFNLRFQIN